ncbi:MAG: protein kinase domain-containing protein [Polyangiaceae bacterium]
MTKQKKQKQLVRARMAKTGESYQSAHRAVSKGFTPAPTSDGADAASAKSMIGRVVAGRYALLRLVASPGGEQPWALYDAKHVLLGSEVTLKVLPSGSDPSLRRWLLREGQALQRAGHPQVIRVFDIGETEDEDLYLLLERLPGVTLAAYLDARPLDERMALELMRQLAQLFAHLHDKGVTPLGLHDRVLNLEERDGAVTLKIGSLPFAGLAGEPRLPPPAAVFTRPAWMSPEERRGESGDHRSALYTLGVALHRMLTGRMPSEHAPLPLRRPGSEPSPLEAVCLKLLAEDPSARYASAAALARDEPWREV